MGQYKEEDQARRRGLESEQADNPVAVAAPNVLNK